MTNDDFSTMLEVMVAASREAGARIMEVYRRDFAAETKADGSPLTEADMAAHRCILSRLNEAFPDVPVLSEESKGIAYEERRAWRRFFLVDPLDGTKEFVKRNNEFTVNIALIEDGVPVLGAVYAPVPDVAWWGGPDGSRRQDGDAAPRVLAAATPESLDGLRVVGSRSHRSDAVKTLLESLPRHDLIAMGSSLKICAVADGGADFYPRLGPTSEWDTAAAHAVVHHAGGEVVGLDGAPLVYNKENILNPFFLVLGGEGPLRAELLRLSRAAAERAAKDA